MASVPQTSTKPMTENKNMAGGQLHVFSRNPLTGYYKDGFCRTVPEDTGNHAIAAEVTKDFLNYSSSKGNNLRDIGVSSGMKWCLCASRWAEAYSAWQDGELSKEVMPMVYLLATHKSALDKVSYKQLKEFAAEHEAPSATGRQDTYDSPESGGGHAKKHNSLGGNMGTTAPSEQSRTKGRWDIIVEYKTNFM